MSVTSNFPRKGRGALSNPAGRFENRQLENFNDGWGLQEPEELPPLETTVTPEPARSIISRNQSPDIPFSQSINPYRGCEHGCIYCLLGDTPILMADGRLSPLADLRPGDEIYGTQRQGWYRHYVKTRVSAQWSVIKPAFQIQLQDGTKLIAGADHRFLTERGWKFVIDSEHQNIRRPHLTTHNKLMGTGAFAGAPDKNRDYQQGYLCGLIRGDGHLASYYYKRAGRAHGNQHQFRLTLCDDEALIRASRYLLDWDVATQPFVFQEAGINQRYMNAIRTNTQLNVTRIGEIIGWPVNPSLQWRQGFLAGIFDAEGSFSQGILRISNTDGMIIEWISSSLKLFGFNFTLERPRRQQGKPMHVIRLLGGLREHLRFFHSVENGILRKRNIDGQAVKSSAELQVVEIKPLGGARRLFDITTGTGDFIANGVVSHNCYARPSHAYLNLSPGLDFETKLFYKDHAAELLEKELRKPGYRCQPIALGANTDPYQPIECKLEVTRSLLTVLLRFRHPVSIITKSTLITRDLDILGDMAALGLATVMVSVTTLDDGLKRVLEPRAPSARRRLSAMRELAKAHIPVGVLTAPIIPMVNDADLERILEQAAEVGAICAGYVLLRLPHELKILFREWLELHLPERAEHVMSLIRQSHGGNDYAAEFGTRMRGTGQYAELIAQRFKHACKRLNLLPSHRMQPCCTRFQIPSDSPQLDLLAL